MKVFKAINLFFFGSESIEVTDALWFYGTYSFCAAYLLFLYLI